MAAMFDTHKFVKTLEASGLPRAQAEALSDAMRDAQESANLVTRIDLVEFEARQDKRFVEMEAWQDKRFVEMEARQDKRLDEFRLGVEQRFASVDQRLAIVEGKIILQGWMLGVIVAGVAALILKTFFHG